MTTSPWLPPELDSLISQLEVQAAPDPAQLEAIASWRLACGDGRGAARWRRWSLAPPDPNAIREALRPLLLLLEQPQLASRLGQGQGWEAVLVALEHQQLQQARQLQQQALAAQQPLQAAMTLRLAGLWQQCGDLQPALDLLEPMAHAGASASLVNAIAHLHEQRQAPASAAPWWDRSLTVDPRQPAVLMQRSRNALALNEPALAFQLAQTLIELDPGHAVAQELRVEALERLGARASQRLALAPLVRQGRVRYLQQAQALAAWWAPRRRRQLQWRDHTPVQALGPRRPLPDQAVAGCRQIGLLGSRDGLELQSCFQAAASTGVVWDLGSREPLCSQRNLRHLLPAGWELRPWHRWQPEHHGRLDVLVISDPRLGLPAAQPERVLIWQNGWCLQP